MKLQLHFKGLVFQISWLCKTSCCHFSFYIVTHVLNEFAEFDEWNNTIIVLDKYIFYFVYDFSNETKPLTFGSLFSVSGIAVVTKWRRTDLRSDYSFGLWVAILWFSLAYKMRLLYPLKTQCEDKG